MIQSVYEGMSQDYVTACDFGIYDGLLQAVGYYSLSLTLP